MADSKAAGRWETTAGGGIVCVGIRGALTGKPLDVLIKRPGEGPRRRGVPPARDAAWEFWEQVAGSAFRPAKVVLIMTRWRADDLAGGSSRGRHRGVARRVRAPRSATAPTTPRTP